MKFHYSKLYKGLSNKKLKVLRTNTKNISEVGQSKPTYSKKMRFWDQRMIEYIDWNIPDRKILAGHLEADKSCSGVHKHFENGPGKLPTNIIISN